MYRFAPNAQGWADPLGLEAAAPAAEGVLSMGAGAAGEGVVGRVLSALVRYNPVLWVLMLSGDTPQNATTATNNKTTVANPSTVGKCSTNTQCKPCNPPAGVMFNKQTHSTHDHGNCLARTGSMTHWHYSVNHQRPYPDCTCFTAKHEFGGCGVTP